MQKKELIFLIADNVMVYKIKVPSDFQGNNLHQHLEKFDEKVLKAIAGFNKKFLEHFIIISKGKDQKDIQDIIEKMEKISYMIGPTGTLSYLTEDQIEYILTKLGNLALKDINDEKISLIADEKIEQQFGAGNVNAPAALENQISSAAFYLAQIGYSQQDIQQKIGEVRQEPSKLDALFNLPPKEIQSLPPELQGGADPTPPSSQGEATPSGDTSERIEGYIDQIEQDHPPERAAKVKEVMEEIHGIVKDNMTDQYDRVLKQMHPDRLNRAYRMLKDVKRKNKRQALYLEWFFCSHLIENIEFKVEHWQVSSASGHGNTGVYSAGISYSRYDNIIRDFDDGKLAKVINIARRILREPSKKAIQKLGQDLVAETGFDEHLYFTD